MPVSQELATYLTSVSRPATHEVSRPVSQELATYVTSVSRLATQEVSRLSQPETSHLSNLGQ